MEDAKKIIPLEEIKKEVSLMEITKDFPFKKALSEEGMSIIAEVKKASPSKGLIAKDFDYITIAKDYEQVGASAISVLTEPFFFMGSDDYLSEIAQNVSIPILRKDFVVDEYMIWEAKLLGASAVLLIVSISLLYFSLDTYVSFTLFQIEFPIVLTCYFVAYVLEILAFTIFTFVLILLLSSANVEQINSSSFKYYVLFT